MLGGIPHLTPAYGKDYKNKSEAELAFASDYDFLLDGKPVNKSQLIEMGHTQANVRYKGLRSVTVIKFGPDDDNTIQLNTEIQT